MRVAARPAVAVLLVVLLAGDAAAQLPSFPAPANPLLPGTPPAAPQFPQSTAPQAAGDLPDYAVQAHCEGVARLGGTLAQTIYASCIEQEQAAYDALRPIWASLAETVRTQCDEITRFGGASGSFVMLRNCVEVHRHMPPQQPTPQFRRW